MSAVAVETVFDFTPGQRVTVAPDATRTDGTLGAELRKLRVAGTGLIGGRTYAGNVFVLLDGPSGGAYVDPAHLTVLALPRPHLKLVRASAHSSRIDWLAVSGALLLLLAVLLGLADAAHVFAGGDPVGLGMVALMAAIPGLTVWAHRLDRRCGRGGPR